MVDSDKRRFGFNGGGFTLVELVIVVAILLIAAMVAIPMLTSAETFQLRAVANMIAADLEYAKQMAITRGGKYSVVFQQGTESYKIVDQDGSVIAHPVKIGFSYSVDLKSDSRTDKVNIASVNFGSTQTVKFDYLGSPYNGSDKPLNIGEILLQAGEDEITINVEPVTGHISFQ